MFFTFLSGLVLGWFLYQITQFLLKKDQYTPLLQPTSIKWLALITTPIILLLSFTFIQPSHLPAMILFLSALIIASLTDLQSFMISRFTSLFLVPIGWLLSWFNLLPISLVSSVIGTIAGYLILYLTARIFFAITKKTGLGQGDIDLITFIGAFTGPMGIWSSILFGSLLGSAAGFLLIATKRGNRYTPIPYGPFLALGALVYIFSSNLILKFLSI